MVKILSMVLIFMMVFAGKSALAIENIHGAVVKCNRFTHPESVMSYGEYIEKLQKERAIIYNALNLSDEQIQIYEDMMSESVPCYENRFNNLMKECYKLKAMQDANANECDILRQRRVVKNLKNNLEKSFNKDTNTFKKCLNSQQRAKYSMIKKLAHDDIKKASHKKDYYKSNPQMLPFGNPDCQ